MHHWGCGLRRHDVFRSVVWRRQQHSSVWPQCRLQLVENDHSRVYWWEAADGGDRYITSLVTEWPQGLTGREKSLFTGDNGGIMWGAGQPSRSSSTLQKNRFLMTSQSFRIILLSRLSKISGIWASFCFTSVLNEPISNCVSVREKWPKMTKMKCVNVKPAT